MPRTRLPSVALACPGFLHCGSLAESGAGCGVVTAAEVDDDKKEHAGMTKPGAVQARMRTQMLRCAEAFLVDAGNISVSRQMRVEACFESIYIRLLVSAHGAAEPQPEQHPSERVILAGAATSGLDTESLEDVLELNSAVADCRHKPGTDTVNLLHALTLARRIAQLVKA